MRSGMIRMAMTMGAAVCIGTATAQTFSVNLGSQGGDVASAAESDVVKVVARGVGLNETDALKDAYRDAVERAVGLYVDAETAAKNDAIVKVQVLTQSNAYVTHYDKIESEKIDGGLTQVRIVATVKKQALATKLQGVMPPQTVKVDSGSLKDAFAQMASKEKQAGDAAELLKAALADVDPIKSLLVANLRPDTQQLLTGDTIKLNNQPLPANKVLLRYLFELKLDRQKYFNEFVPHLKKTLDQISLTPPKEVRLVELAYRDNYDNPNKAIEEYVSGKEIGGRNQRPLANNFSNGSIYDTHGESRGSYDFLHLYAAMIGGNNIVWKYRGSAGQWAPKSGGSFSWQDVPLTYGEFDSSYAKSKVVFCLITQLNGNASNGKVAVYELDKKVIDVIGDWIFERVGHGDFRKRRGPNNNKGKKSNYSIVFLDKGGEELGVYPWEINRDVLINLKVAEIPNAGMVYCAPFVGCFGESYIEWKDFILDKDILPKIASIKIESAD